MQSMHMNSQGVLSKPGLLADLRLRWMYLVAFLLTGFFLGAAASIVLLPFAATAPAVPLADTGSESKASSVPVGEAASPRLTPRDVVQMQVQALRDSILDSQQIIRCYQLASPSNRSVTGPLERFSQMVLQHPFTELSSSEHWQVGEALVDGRFASVVVTTCSADGKPAGFRFDLVKQTEPPYVDCWMTETVSPLTLVDFEGRTVEAQHRGGLPGE